jgi:GTP-binding protein HflX
LAVSELSQTVSQGLSTARAILVGVDLGLPHFDSELEELGLLAQTAGLNPVARVTCKRKAPDAALFVGSGKADEIKWLAEQHGAHEILFDQSLSPAQQRNLERHTGLAVNDSTLLILEIFAQRARSHEGKLQVELARLQYLSTRLVRRWSHLERQRGGIGTRGGPGETQIELDRRMIGEAIKRTKDRLQKVKRQRQTQRRQRTGATVQRFRWSATPMPASQRCSMPWSRRAPTRPISCSPRWTPRPDSSTWAKLAGRCRCRTRWASSATCRTA